VQDRQLLSDFLFDIGGNFFNGFAASLEIADIGYVLVSGENRYTDTGAALMADPEVRRSFLGG